MIIKLAFALLTVVVVRGGFEPPTFRFSEGFEGPAKSIAERLTRPDVVSAARAVHG
jgi:hypothetical protein